MMRKIIITSGAFLVTLAILFLASSLALSFWVAKNYAKTLERFNTSNVVFKLIKFHRGWFQSTASIQVATKNNKLLIAELSQHIQNGPVIINKSYAGFAIAHIITRGKTNQLQFILNTSWNFNDTFSNKLQAAKIYLNETKQQIRLNGLQATLNINPSKMQGRIHFTLNNIAFKYPPDLQINIQQLQSKANFKSKAGLWFGQRKVTIKKLVIATKKERETVIKNIKLIANHQQKNQSSTIVLHYRAALLKSKNYHFKPMEIKLNISNINTAALTNLIKHLTSAPNSPAGWLQLYAPVDALVGQGLQININPLKFTTPVGTVTLTAVIKLLKQENQTTNLLFLNKYTFIKANLSIPKKWLRQNLIRYYKSKLNSHPSLHKHTNPFKIANQKLQTWLNNKIFIVKGTQLEMNLKYQGGLWLINGNQPTFH